MILSMKVRFGAPRLRPRGTKAVTMATMLGAHSAQTRLMKIGSLLRSDFVTGITFGPVEKNA